jgi:hypothetical protein
MKLNITLAVLSAAEDYLDAAAQLDRDYPFDGDLRDAAMRERGLHHGLCYFVALHAPSTRLSITPSKWGRTFKFIADAMEAMDPGRSRDRGYHLDQESVTDDGGPTKGRLHFVRDFIDYIHDTYRV